MNVRTLVLALLLATPALAQSNAQPKDDFRPPPTTAHPQSTGAVPQSVLDDFIAGFNGDDQAIDRAMSATADIMLKDPNNAEALAWNSSGKGVQTGAAFRSGDFQKGMQLWRESQEGMNKAVEMDPNNPRIRVIRGKSMLEGSLHDPNPGTSNASAQMAIDDLENAVNLMGDRFEKNAPKNFRQEMYSWMYQAAAKVGDKEKAEKYKKLAGDMGDQAKKRLEEAAGNTVSETAFAATTILDSDFVKTIKADLMQGLRSPAKLDEVVATLDKQLDAKPDNATAMAWRGFARTLRSSSLLAQGQLDEGSKMWDKGNTEIGKAASTDPTNRDAVLLRGLSNLERARQESDDTKRKDEATKAVTDFTRFQRLVKDASVTLSPDASAELQLTIARAYRQTEEWPKAKAALDAGIAVNQASPEVTKKLQAMSTFFK
jgi:tetratricopeptide (TPR) repeat protein